MIHKRTCLTRVDTRRYASFLVVGIVLSWLALLPVTSAGAVTTPGIGPNQLFTGLVNGKASDATVTVVCPSPAAPNQTGHPAGNQTLAVEPASSVAAGSGYTGSQGKAVAAGVVIPAGTTSKPLVFRAYGSKALPKTLVVPCSGPGEVVFAPRPTSRTARSATVDVTFVNLAVARA